MVSVISAAALTATRGVRGDVAVMAVVSVRVCEWGGGRGDARCASVYDDQRVMVVILPEGGETSARDLVQQSSGVEGRRKKNEGKQESRYGK